MSNFLFNGIKAIWNGITGQAAVDKQNEYNFKLQQYQNDYNTQMWNLQNQANIDLWNKNNEYNTPAAQVQRLRDAGLHPSLAFGGSAGNSSGPVSVGSPQPAAAIAQTRTANYLGGIIGIASTVKSIVDMMQGIRMNDSTIRANEAKIGQYQESARALQFKNWLNEGYQSFLSERDALHEGHYGTTNRYKAKLLAEFERDMADAASRESGARLSTRYNNYDISSLDELLPARKKSILAKYSLDAWRERMQPDLRSNLLKRNSLLQAQFDNFDALHGPRSAEGVLGLLLYKLVKDIGEDGLLKTTLKRGKQAIFGK